MKNTQNRTVELYNVNIPYYWDVEKFVNDNGYQNVCEYCADVFDRLGSVEWCTSQATEDMYKAQYEDLELLYEDILNSLNEKYNIVCIPTQGRWNGTYKGGLQDCKHIDMCLQYDVQKVTIKDKALIIDVAHHDGNNQYILYFVDTDKPTTEEYYNMVNNNGYSEYVQGVTLNNEKDIKDYIKKYAIDLYDLWYHGKI